MRAPYRRAQRWQSARDEAALVCAIWSYRNVDGRIDIHAAHDVATQNFALRDMGVLEDSRFEESLFALARLHIVGYADGVVTMPDTVELSYS